MPPCTDGASAIFSPIWGSVPRDFALRYRSATSLRQPRAGCTARIRPTDWPGVDVGNVPNAPFAGMSDGLAQARHDNYLPGVAAWQNVIVKDEAGYLKTVGLVLSVIVDRTPLSRIERRYSLRYGILGKVLRQALDHYANWATLKKT